MMSEDVPTIPLYSRPVPLIHKSAIVGMKINPANIGFAWNTEDWRWQ